MKKHAKKLLSWLIACLIAVQSIPFTAIGSFAAGTSVKMGTPVIDGVLDGIWKDSAMIDTLALAQSGAGSLGWCGNDADIAALVSAGLLSSSSSTAINKNGDFSTDVFTHAEIYFLWDAGNLYTFVKVYDNDIVLPTDSDQQTGYSDMADITFDTPWINEHIEQTISYNGSSITTAAYAGDICYDPGNCAGWYDGIAVGACDTATLQNTKLHCYAHSSANMHKTDRDSYMAVDVHADEGYYTMELCIPFTTSGASAFLKSGATLSYSYEITDAYKQSSGTSFSGYQAKNWMKFTGTAQTLTLAGDTAVSPDCTHEWNTEYTTVTEATCTTAGSQSIRCSLCGEIQADSTVAIPALGHDIVTDPAVSAGCTSSGLTAGSHCSRCDDVTIPQEVTSAVGHNYADGFCTRCGQAETTTDTEIPNAVLNCGDYVPVIDGVIDEAYYKSYSITHEWPSEKTGSNYWGSGIWAFNSDGTTTAYDWNKEPLATSYFLWEELSGTNFLYVAVDVNDGTGVFELPEEKLNQALATADYGLWLLDSVCPYFAVEKDGTLHTAQTRVDAGANFGRLDGSEGIISWNTWRNGHEENYTEGLWEVSYKYGEEVDENGDPVKTGYTVEFLWPMSDFTSDVFTEGGEFRYSLQVVDTPIDASYGWDSASLGSGVYVEAYQPEDFMIFNDFNSSNAPAHTLVITEDTVSFGEGGKPSGDVNIDGSIDATDLSLMMKYISGESVNAFELDLNQDNRINTDDIVRLIRYIAGEEGEPAPDTSVPGTDGTFKVGSGIAMRGETIEIPVVIENNPGLSAMSIRPVYDKKVLRFAGITAGDGIWANCETASKYVWASTDGDSYENGTVLTFKFVVLDTAALGDTTVSLIYDGSNRGEQTPGMNIISGTVTVDSADAGHFRIGGGNYLNGETVEIPIVLENNPGMSSIVLSPVYDKSVFELVEIKAGEGVFANASVYSSYVWSNYGNATDNGVICTLVFKVLDSAPHGETIVSAEYSVSDWEENVPVTVTISGVSTVHNASDIVTAPAVDATCTTDGLTEGTRCSVCDTAIIAQDTVPATGHNFGSTSGGKKTCTVCGFVSDLRVGTYTVVFESSLTVNLKIRKDVFTAGGYTDPYIVAEKLGTTYVLTEYYEEESYIVFPFKNHPPQTMGDLFTFTVHATKDGEAVVSEEYQSASICSYIASVWGQSTTTDALKTMLADLLEYGYQAQLVKNHNTDAPVTDCIDAAELAKYATETDPTLENVTSAKYVELDGATAAWKTYSLTLDSAIQLNLFFTLDGNDTTGITVELRNEAGDLLETVAAEDLVYDSASGRYRVKFIKLDATKMYDSVYATVCRDGVVISNTMRTSIASYAKVLIDGGSDLADVAKAMMKYGAAAVAYGG